MVTLENAFLIINSKDEYMILESPLVVHDLKAHLIKAEKGTLKKYRKDSSLQEPYESLQFKDIVLDVKE